MEVGAFYLECIVKSGHHFSFSPHIEDSLMHRCGSDQGLYHPLWDGDLPSLEDGTRGCKYPNQLIVGNYLQGQQSVIHHNDMYPTGFVTSMSQRFHIVIG